MAVITWTSALAMKRFVCLFRIAAFFQGSHFLLMLCSKRYCLDVCICVSGMRVQPWVHGSWLFINSPFTSNATVTPVIGGILWHPCMCVCVCCMCVCVLVCSVAHVVCVFVFYVCSCVFLSVVCVLCVLEEVLGASSHG